MRWSGGPPGNWSARVVSVMNDGTARTQFDLNSGIVAERPVADAPGSVTASDEKRPR